MQFYVIILKVYFEDHFQSKSQFSYLKKKGGLVV